MTGNRKTIGILLVFAAVISVLLFFACTVAVFASGVKMPPEKARLGVILGNEVLRDGTPSPRLQARLDCGAVLFRAKLVDELMVSGGTSKAGLSEAAVMKAYLVEGGIPEEAIIADVHGDNSYLTAKHAAAYLSQTGGESSATAISQWFHCARAKLAMQRFGIARVECAHPNYLEWRDVYSFFREIPALIFYFVRPYPRETSQ